MVLLHLEEIKANNSKVETIFLLNSNNEKSKGHSVVKKIYINVKHFFFRHRCVPVTKKKKKITMHVIERNNVKKKATVYKITLKIIHYDRIPLLLFHKS